MEGVDQPTARQRACKPKHARLGCCAVMALLGIFISEGMLTQVCGALLTASVVMQESTIPSGSIKWSSSKAFLRVYNLTNGYELLRKSPPPKPIFQEVTIPLTVTVTGFDFKLQDDGNAYSYKNFLRMEATNLADNDLYFVNVNTVLLEALASFPGLGSESRVSALAPFVPAFAALDNVMQYDFFFARRDGSGPFGAGLLKRMTIRELLHGYYDPVFGIYLTQGLQRGRFNVFKSQAALETALANESEPGYIYTDVRMTGKEDFLDAGRIVSLKGFENLTKDFVVDDLSGMEAPGWDANGNCNASTRESMIFKGLRSWSQPLPASSTCPSSLNSKSASIRPGPAALNFTIFDDRQGMIRSAKYVCAENCKGERIQGALWAYKYEQSDDNWQLKVNGEIDENGACASHTSASRCDYAMRYPYIMESRAVLNTAAFALPYFGNTSQKIKNATVILDEKGNSPVYDRETMGDKIWVDPLSGSAFKYRSDVFRLTPIDKLMIDHPRHANIFAGDNANRMYWPYFRYEVELTRTEEDLRGVANSLGILYTIMLWVTLISAHFLLSIACGGCCLVCASARASIQFRMKNRKMKIGEALTRTRLSEKMQASKDTCRPAMSLEPDTI